MDIHKYRRTRLEAYIESDCGGSRSQFAVKARMSTQRVAQMLSDSFRNGDNFGTRAARNLEQVLGLPENYFDEGAYPDGEGAGPHAAPKHQPTPPVSRVADPVEQVMVRTYREADDETKSAIQRIFRALPLAEKDSIGDLAYEFARAIIDRKGLQVVPRLAIVHEAFDKDEQFLLTRFRALPPTSQRVILHAAGCAEQRDDDDDIDSGTQCTQRELRLIMIFRKGSNTLRRILLAGVTPEDASIDARKNL